MGLEELCGFGDCSWCGKGEIRLLEARSRLGEGKTAESGVGSGRRAGGYVFLLRRLFGFWGIGGRRVDGEHQMVVIWFSENLHGR